MKNVFLLTKSSLKYSNKACASFRFCIKISNFAAYYI